MVPLSDFLTDRIDGARASVLSALRICGRVNGFCLYGVRGTEQMVPLTIAHSLTKKFRDRYSAMLEATAHLMDMTPQSLIVAVEMSKQGQEGTLHPDRWLGTVLRRLRAMGPDYFLLAGEVDLLEKLDIGSGRRDLSVKGRRGIVVVGCNSVRALAIVTPFSVGERGLLVGEAVVLDSMLDGGGWMGRLGAVYAPYTS
ncbi:hypothetical protein ACFL2T_01130 [Elusimicrobiota bacterium]